MDDGGRRTPRARWNLFPTMMTAAAAVGGCAHLPFGHASHEPPVQPASREAQQDIDSFLAPSAALASAADAVVRVVGPQMTCTGTLIAEDLVLTAHHCVVERTAHGDFRSKNPPARGAVQVEAGGGLPALGQRRALGCHRADVRRGGRARRRGGAGARAQAGGPGDDDAPRGGAPRRRAGVRGGLRPVRAVAGGHPSPRARGRCRLVGHPRRLRGAGERLPGRLGRPGAGRAHPRGGRRRRA